MMNRRTLTIGLGAGLVLAACGGPEGPGTLTLRAQAAPGANPGPDGTDRPLALTLLQLDAASAFQAADFFALQDPSEALGTSLLQADRIVLPPGGSEARTLAIVPGAQVIGVVANYREPSGKAFRATAPAPTPGEAASLIVSAGPGGVTLRPA